MARKIRFIDRVEAALLPLLFRLPPQVLKALAGKPIHLDGQTLGMENQLLLRLLKLTGRDNLSFTPQSRQALNGALLLCSGTGPIGETREVMVDGGNGPIAARLYVPAKLVNSAGRDPLFVFFHRGGFVTGSIATHDTTCRLIAERAGIRVLSVEYGLSPENQYPAPGRDGIAAYRWVVNHASELGADSNRLAVGGDSAGGTIAADTAIAAAKESLPLRLQMLAYPATNFDPTEHPKTRTLFARGFFLTADAVEMAMNQYLPR